VRPPQRFPWRRLTRLFLPLTLAACAHAEPIPTPPAHASLADVERGVHILDDQPSGIWSDRWVTPSAYAHYLEARIHQQNERLDLALENVRLALAFDPDSPVLYTFLAELRLADDDLPGARAALAEALEHDADSPGAHLIRARIAEKDEDWLGAAKDAEHAIALDPSLNEAYFELASLRIRLGDLTGAMTIVQAAIARWPFDPRAHILLGNLAEETGDLDRAADAYQEVIDLRPRSNTGYTRLADVRIRQERLEDAFDVFVECTDACVNAPGCWFRRVRLARARAAPTGSPATLDRAVAQEIATMADALASDPEQAAVIASRFLAIDDEPLLLAFVQHSARKRANLVELNHYLGLLYQRLDRDKDAIAAFKRVPHQSRFYLESRVKLAITLSELGRHREAVAAIDAAIVHEPEVVELWSMKGALLERAGRLDLAVPALGRAAGLAPERVELSYRLAVVAWKRRDAAVTIDALNRVIELSPRDAIALNFLGFVLAELGRDLDRAERLVRRALELHVGNKGSYIDTLGWIQFRLGRRAEAIETLTAAVELLPTEPGVLEHLGDVYLADGQPEPASSPYLRALELTREPAAQARLRRKLRKLGRRRPGPRP